MRLVGRERAVLAVAAASPRQRQREVAAERDAAAHAQPRILRTARAVRAPYPAPPHAPSAGSHPRPDRARAAFWPAAARRLEPRPQSRTRRSCSTSPPTPSTPASTRRSRAPSTRARASTSTWSAPSARTDSIKLLETGRANFAILDIHDLAIARERGQDIVGIMAIVERPLAAVIAAPRSATRASSRARRSASPASRATPPCCARSSPAPAAIPAKVKTVTIGFNAVPALLAGRVAAATAFWNDEGVTLQRRRPGFHVFRVDDYGAPAYPSSCCARPERSLQRGPGPGPRAWCARSCAATA